jgi:hypothetical protein
LVLVVFGLPPVLIARLPPSVNEFTDRVPKAVSRLKLPVVLLGACPAIKLPFVTSPQLGLKLPLPLPVWLVVVMTTLGGTGIEKGDDHK